MSVPAPGRSISSTAAWLKDLYARFDDDIEALHQIELFWKPCVKCGDGYCCWTESFYASATVGNPFAAVEWYIALEYVRDNFNAQDRENLARNMLSNRTACVFLFGNRCKIYPNRSWISRIHPYSISFFPGKTVPEGEVAVPSCPKYASAFGVKINELKVTRPRVTGRDEKNRLVQLKLPKRKPVWFIDATAYIGEYEQYLNNRNTVPNADPFADLLRLAGEAGKEKGELVQKYLKQTLHLE